MPLNRPVAQQRRIPQVPGAGKMSLKSRTATDGVASNDVGDFDRFGFAGKPNVNVASEGQQQNPHELVGRYNDLGAALKKSDTFVEVAQKIAEIAEIAETTVMQEAGDWFDEHTIKRNMKEMKNYAGQFSKIAEELDGLHQRAQALYDDMGNVLNRYFDIGGQDQAAGNDPSSADQGAADMGAQDQVGEAMKPCEFCHETDGHNPQCPKFDADGMYVHEAADVDADAELDKNDWNIKEAGNGIKEPKDWKCLECGRKMTAKAAERAVNGDRGCPKCGGVDIDQCGPNEGVVKTEGNDVATAQRAFHLPDAIAQGLTGITKDQAREIIKRSGAKTVREAQKALVKDVKAKLLTGGADNDGEPNQPPPFFSGKTSHQQMLDDPNMDDDATGFKEDCGSCEMDEADDFDPKNHSFKSAKKPLPNKGASKEERIRKAAESGPYGNVTVQGKRINFMLAQAMVAIMDGLSPDNKAKFLGMSIEQMMVTTAKLYHKPGVFKFGSK